ncbi:hypothetical protein [Paraburkholderia pallida]|uniref:Uncharacterized protein n=1 Tax=Paraburkholderia pallida TaxID=2547399 RepID=A0A4P7D6G3_9BURK|nr:hypothetical protein [Paraburkholderia pallida]QBR04356.1 hypothetical protein E1956_45510 [Paraburkholderia pallida]
MTVSVADLKNSEKSLATALDKARTFAEGTHCGLGLEHDSSIDRTAPAERERPFRFQAKDFQPVRTARSRKGDWLRHETRIFHKIKILRSGFEV